MMIIYMSTGEKNRDFINLTLPAGAGKTRSGLTVPLAGLVMH